MTQHDFRALLRALDAVALAALLHELGFELYRREIARWRVLGELADELADQATFAARRNMVTLWTRRARARRRPARRRR
jgi:hypothetical protein